MMINCSIPHIASAVTIRGLKKLGFGQIRPLSSFYIDFMSNLIKFDKNQLNRVGIKLYCEMDTFLSKMRSPKGEKGKNGFKQTAQTTRSGLPVFHMDFIDDLRQFFLRRFVGRASRRGGSEWASPVEAQGGGVVGVQGE